MKILIIRVSAIGDVVHTLPCLFLLKQLMPTCSIHWVVQQKAADLLIGQSPIERVWVLPDRYLAPRNIATTIAIVRELRAQRWDAIIDFQGLLKTSLIMMLLRGKKFGFSSQYARSSITTWCTHYRHTPLYTNIVQKNLSLTSFVASELGGFSYCPATYELAKNFVFDVDEQRQRAVDTWFVDRDLEGKRVVILAPNTTWREKHWPVEYWVRLIELWRESSECGSFEFVLVGKDHGAAAYEVYSDCLRLGIKLLIAPKWDLAALAHAVKRSSLIIAPDTGIVHLADFLNIGTIALFGPTNKDIHGPFWSPDNVRNACQIPGTCCPQKCIKKQNTVFCPGGMYTLKPEELFERVCGCLGMSGGRSV